MLFRGLSAFPITPANGAGIVDTPALRRQVRRLSDAGVDSIGLLGSTGAAPYFTRAERRRAVEAAVAEAAGRTPILVGIGALTTAEVLALGEDAAACGADAVLLAPVSYHPLTEEEVYRLAATAAGAIPLPLCLYNNPGTTRFVFSPALTARLSRVPRIEAVKNPASATPEADLTALRAQAAPGFSLGVSVDALATEALLAGADAWYSVLAGTLPQLCVPIVQAVRQGDHARARTLNAALQPVWDLFNAHTSLRTVYTMVNLLGIADAQPPPPILPLGPQARRAVAALLDNLAAAGYKLA